MELAAKIGTMARRGAPLPEYGGLCFTAQAANSSVQLTAKGSAPTVTLIKSFDGLNWSDYNVGDVIDLPSVGDFVYLAAGEGGNNRFASATTRYHKFVISGLVAATGDITSLRRFDLEQTTMAAYCYYSMFNGCKGLTSAPELPATTMANYCYYSMFRGCTGLTSAPELPATTMAALCYHSMFRECTGLTSIKVRFTTSWRAYTTDWVDGVSSVGTFYKPSALPEEFGTSKIPEGWSVVNID